MSMIRRSICVAAFAFSLCAWADASYFGVFTDTDFGGYTYGWGLTSHDVFSHFFPDVDDSYIVDMGGWLQCDGDGDSIPYIEVFPFDPSLDSDFLEFPYFPFNPAYTDPVAPSSDPLSGSPSGGGGEGEGGFDPSSTLNGASTVVGGLAVAVVGVITAAALICILFIYWRKTKTSFHICEDRYGRLSLSKTRW